MCLGYFKMNFKCNFKYTVVKFCRVFMTMLFSNMCLYIHCMRTHILISKKYKSGKLGTKC